MATTKVTFDTPKPGSYVAPIQVSGQDVIEAKGYVYPRAKGASEITRAYLVFNDNSYEGSVTEVLDMAIAKPEPHNLCRWTVRFPVPSGAVNSYVTLFVQAETGGRLPGACEIEIRIVAARAGNE